MPAKKLVTDLAVLVCNHQTGIVANKPSQSLVTIAGRSVLVDNDPEHRSIAGCTMATPTIKPCTTTLAVTSGYSELIRIRGRRVCLDAVTGLTDWAGANVQYKVRTPGQTLVSERDA